MKEKTLVICLASALLILFVALSWREQKLLNEPYRNGWWSVSFDDPKGDGFGFMLENEGPARSFDWKISADDRVLEEGKQELAAGQEGNVAAEPDLSGIRGKVSLEVSAGENDSKTLYKVLP